MLPQSLLRAAYGQSIRVELKNGEAYNGTLFTSDGWMNLVLKQVICTSRSGDRFWKMPECSIRGNAIKYICVRDELIDQVKETMNARKERNVRSGRGDRGGRGGFGRGRGGRGGDRGGASRGGGRGGRGGGGRGGGRE